VPGSGDSVGRRGCGDCGAGPLPRTARWCPNCGNELGSLSSARLGVTVSGRSRLLLPVALIVLIVAAAAAVLGSSPWPDDATRGDTADRGTDPAAAGVELAAPGSGEPGGPEELASPGTQPGRAAEQPAGSPDTAPAPTCDADGCAHWRSTVLDHQPILVSDGRLVQVRFEEIVAVDDATGRWLWRHSHDDMRMWDPTQVVTAFHVDDRTVALAYGTRVRIHAAATGTVLGEVDVGPTRVNDLRRHDGQLLASGRQRVQGATGLRVIGLNDRAEIRFSAEVDALLREERQVTSTTAPLLAVIDGRLARLDATDGRVRWQRELAGRRVDGTTLLDPDTGEVAVISTRDGSELLTRTRPGAVAAGVRDGVLVITMEDRVELHDRDGTALGAVAVTEPGRTVVAATGRRIVVAELPAGGASQRTALTLRTGRRAGGATALPTVTSAATAPLPPDHRPDTVEVMRRSDGLVLSGPDPRDAWLVDPTTVTATPLDLPEAPTREVVHRDGISLIRDGTRLHIMGAAGRFTVERATQIATTDPLIVHGVHGTLRLNRDLVDAGPDVRQAPVGPAGEVQASPRRPPLQRHGLGLAR